MASVSHRVRIDHTLGQAVTLSRGGVDLFTLDYGGKAKPYIHPLATVSGHVLTLFQPSDHVWHRGLWFAFKFVNGENFWEEAVGQPVNRQVAVRPAGVVPGEDGSVGIELELAWRTHGGSELLRERRRVTYRPVSEAAYALDHVSHIVAKADVVLDRTPFTTWGGYGGLCFRGTRNWLETKLRLSDGTETDRPKGFPADWATLAGKLDGDLNLHAGVAILDHPGSLRHPVPWYGSTGVGHYLTPAPLFHEPLRVKAGETVRLAYRVIAHEGVLAPERVQEHAVEFCGEDPWDYCG